MDENKSWYLQKNIVACGNKIVEDEDMQNFQESNKMRCKHLHFDCTCLIHLEGEYTAIFQQSFKSTDVCVYVCSLLAVNGFMYGNLPELYVCEGDQVVWHLLGLGSVDLYGVYFQGNTFKLDNTTRDTVTLFPHSSVTVSMTPDNDGNSI